MSIFKPDDQEDDPLNPKTPKPEEPGGTAPTPDLTGATSTTPTPQAASGPKTFTANDPGVADLLKYNPSWTTEDAVAWANKNYSWQNADNTATPPGGGGGSTSAALGGQAQGPVATTPPTPGATPQTVQDVYRQALLNKLQGPTPAQAAADAANSPMLGAYRTQQQRQEDRDRANLAERAAAEGFSGSGAFDTQLMGLGQARGERESSFAAQLSQKAYDDRAQELTQAIQMAQNAYQFDTAQALQKQLAELQAEMQKQGFAVQTRGQDIQQQLGMGDLDLRKLLGTGQLDLQKLGLLLNNDQANNVLGFNYTQLEALERDKQIDRILHPENYT